MKPVIAIVGRPNVGKSTLFNRITKSRDAIVADFAGLTRDRHYGDARLGNREFIVVDTGGFEPDKPTGVVAGDGAPDAAGGGRGRCGDLRGRRARGLSAQDHDIARFLRTQQKRVVLAANKAEGMTESPLLGSSSNWASATRTRCRRRTGRASAACWKRRWWTFPDEDEPTRTTAADARDPPGGGRPAQRRQVTLINAWLGEERLVAFDQPGTTRDAIHVPFERDGRRFELIDTAGLRRKGKVFEAIEKFSVVKTLQAIADANVVLLLIDATQGVSDQDAHIAGYILESGRAVVVAINKWDATDDYQRQTLQRSIESRLSFLKFAPVLHISAIRRQGLNAVWKALLQAHASATIKMTTPVLTRLVHEAVSTRRRAATAASAPRCAMPTRAA
jgi:GTP-binding protein